MSDVTPLFIAWADELQAIAPGFQSAVEHAFSYERGDISEPFLIIPVTTMKIWNRMFRRVSLCFTVVPSAYYN